MPLTRFACCRARRYLARAYRRRVTVYEPARLAYLHLIAPRIARAGLSPHAVAHAALLARSSL